MSHISENIRKSTAIYRSPDNIGNLRIRVKIREVPDESAHNTEIEKELENFNGETKTFLWQQKVYGKFEREFYKDKKNCVTDLEKKYHQDVVNLIQNDDVLFTYVNEDDFTLVAEGCVANSKILTDLYKRVNNTLLVNDEDFLFKNSDAFDFKECFMHSLKNPYSFYNFETMHIMADLGEYVGDTWLKAEYILCMIKYDHVEKILIVFPDFTNFEPYYIQIEGDVKRTFQYYIENASETVTKDILLKENEILNKIASYQTKLKLQKTGANFELPVKNRLNVFLFIEILKAKRFEYNDIHIQYFIDLPKNWFCKDPSALKGTTQTSHSSSDDNLSYFGFPFEICLEYDAQKKSNFSNVPYIYFEVISKDSWDRFRTEGITYTILPVSGPGSYNYNLCCLRICPKGPYGNLKRFFIGDCSSYNDITWISVPKDYDKKIINKYGTDTVGTGEISIRIDVMHQSQEFMADSKDEASQRHKRFILENLNKSSLVKSIEQVVEAFKIAKRKMIEARKNV